MRCGNAASPQHRGSTKPQCCDVTYDLTENGDHGDVAKPHPNLLSLRRGTRQGKKETKSTTDKIASGGRSGGP